MSYLPTLEKAEQHARTIANAVEAYRALCMKREWTGADVTAQQQRAYHTIQSRARQLADALALEPSEREPLHRALRDAREAIAARDAVIARLKQQVDTLRNGGMGARTGSL